MRTAIGTNRNASMRGGNLNVEVGVAHGIADLVIGATGSENGERTRIGNVSRKRKTSSNINHVLFGNTNVEQALCVFRTSLSKFLCGGGAGKVGVYRNNLLTACGKLSKRYAKCSARCLLFLCLFRGSEFYHVTSLPFSSARASASSASARSVSSSLGALPCQPAWSSMKETPLPLMV